MSISAISIRHPKNNRYYTPLPVFLESPEGAVSVGSKGDVEEGFVGREFVSVFPEVEDGGAVPDPPAVEDNCANPMEGGSARKTE